MSFTVLLTCPTSGLHAVMAQAERPFRVGAIEKNINSKFAWVIECKYTRFHGRSKEEQGDQNFP